MDVKTAIYHYCNYQDRCHMEVKNKLYALGCNTNEINQYLAEVIEAGLLNEERYACNFARGKFRMLQWGREKIKQGLKVHNISAYCIAKAMKEIDEDEYQLTFNKLAGNKWEELKKERSIATRMAKTYRYLAQKGYERSMITDVLNEYKHQ
jgi:regulatory protein